MTEDEMVARLTKLKPETLVTVKAGDLLAMIELAKSHRAMVPRLQALEQTMLQMRIQAETAQ